MGRYPKDNYHRGEDWAKRHNHFLAKCAKCGKEGLKKTMPALYIRKNTNDTVRVLCRICPDCLPVLRDELGVEMPE